MGGLGGARASSREEAEEDVQQEEELQEEEDDDEQQDPFAVKFVNMSPPRDRKRLVPVARGAEQQMAAARDAQNAQDAQNGAQEEPEVNKQTKMRKLASQVPEEELVRLVQEEAMALPDLGLCLSGLSGRFPQADTVDEFEGHLRAGRDMINDQDEARFACGLWGLPPRAGRLKDLSRFDHEFFGFTQEQANYVDFQLRILYEVVYESLLDAGLNPANLRGSNTGVFFGLHCNEFENAMADDPAFKSNGYYAQFAVKVAQYFDFRGVTLTFDAACASGFVGLHSAVEALREGIIERAVVCSSNIPIHPTGSFIFYQMQMLSPTGYSRFLDSRADGYVKSEACVSCVLESKTSARRNYASFMATQTSVDGYKPEGITFPSWDSQERLIRETKARAGLSTNHIEYLEAHGTGTPAGDPQEARAISNVYFPTPDGASGQDRDQDQDRRVIGPLLVGSVKTSMGHSEAASGLCALAKVALMLEHELIYANLHFDQPNTNIEALMDGRLEFVHSTRPLRAKIIPMSCYGFGGSNVHVICRANEREALGGHPEQQQAELTTAGNLPRLVLMFGRSRAQLEEIFEKLAPKNSSTHNTRACLSDDFLALLDALSADKIDRLMAYRGFSIIDTGGGGASEVARRVERCELEPLAMVRNHPNHHDPGRRVHAQEAVPRACHLLFAGGNYGVSGENGHAHHPSVAGLEQLRPYWSTIERLAVHLAAWQAAAAAGQQTKEARAAPPSVSLVEMMRRRHDLQEQQQQQTPFAIAFTTTIAHQVAMLNLARDTLQVNNLGVPVGHSLGELTCAHAAGLLDEREVILAAYQLGAALDKLKHLIAGKMVLLEGVGAGSAQQVADLVAQQVVDLPTLGVSCRNGPSSITISGTRAEVDQFLAQNKEQLSGVCKMYEVRASVALHNETIMRRDPRVKQALLAALQRVLLKPVGMYERTRDSWPSSVAHDSKHDPKNDDGEDFVLRSASAEYFAEMLCRPVDFERVLADKLEQDAILYDVGPGAELKSQIVVVQTSAANRTNSLKTTQTTAAAVRKFHYVGLQAAAAATGQQNAENRTPIVHRLLHSLGELYLAGATFKLARLYEAQTGRAQEWPVRRRTPSLSSLIRWNHASQLFVPRYPAQFSKSSAKCEMPVDLVQERDKYLAGHCIEGRILHPATGYLFLVWRIFSFTKRKIYDACFQDLERELMPVEFRNVRLTRAIILQANARETQIYVHYEEATGRFEVKEGGSVVVDGWAHTPTERPHGLLYDHVREQIRKSKPRPEEEAHELTKEDVYKQFRVSGYDYGPTFQCIESSSYDGQICRVKFNGHFICLTDSILQSIFLAVSAYAPSGGLFLPTRFDYVRFQPELILAKLRAANLPCFDSSEGSLNTKAKREMMNKIMQRQSDAGKQQQQVGVFDLDEASAAAAAAGNSSGELEPEVESAKELPECIFETYCDPLTGIIVTDGIEMRGIKATPAPRRLDANEVLLESYQFVPDHETPVRDERLTRYEERVASYARACNSMSRALLAALRDGGGGGASGDLSVTKSTHDDHEDHAPSLSYEEYKREHLACVYADSCENPRTGAHAHKANDTSGSKKEEDARASYDIKKNGARTLMSVLDQLQVLAARRAPWEKLRERVHENRVHLLRDLLQASYMHERYVRPLVETVLENSQGAKRAKLRAIEINLGDGILRPQLLALIHQLEPQPALDYALAHPDPNRLHGSQTGSGGNPNSNSNKNNNSHQQQQQHTLKPDNVASLFQDNALKNLDLIVYKDASCYSPTVAPVLPPETLSALAAALRDGGFCLVMLRRSFTLAERVVLALGDESAEQLGALPGAPAAWADTSEQLEARYRSLLEHELVACDGQETQRTQNGGGCGRQLLLVASKSDPGGCCSLLFRLVETASQQVAKTTATTTSSDQTVRPSAEPLLLRVRHDALEDGGQRRLEWLDALREQFAEPGNSPQEANTREQHEQQVAAPSRQERDGPPPPAAPRTVWLCAVATREHSVSGLVGMVQALRRELGSARLRCFYDMHTFAREPESAVSLERIRASATFALALKRDHLWTCVDASGRLGTFRHFTINEFLAPESCSCASQKHQQVVATTVSGEPKVQQTSGAYVNTATRGDLSSFTWFEAPLRYLSGEQRQEQLVRVAYSALNFRDIMLATGRLPLDAISPRLAMSDCLLGLEFSGYEAAPAATAAGAAPRRVMGMVYGRGLATHVLCPRETSIKIEVPQGMSLREAATIPVVYATAVMAICLRGRAQRGESILVHAGSGGVGQAALRLALHYGLEVYTTVGSVEKRAFLMEEFGALGLREAHIFNSRTCDFEHEILRATRGRGCDLVLNSLADEKLQASVNCLADGGRFLEIGKYDMSVDARLELLKLDTNKTFHGILLDKLFDVEELTAPFRGQLERVMAILRQGLSEGFVRPIKHRVFPAHQVEEAFRFMATGKHIGKVLIEIPGAGACLDEEGGVAEGGQRPPPLAPVVRSVPRFQLSPEKSYLVTGGLGGFGLELCKWLVAHGARHLVVTSRQGARTGYQRAVLRRLAAGEGETKRKVLVVTEQEADASTREGATRLIEIARQLAPSKQLGGIFHLAMVLRDTLLENMTRDDFDAVCRPKVDACERLDEATRSLKSDDNLDYFVCFSSVTSGKGNAGQSNYAYANSCLERVCEARRERGAHGLAIQWGAIGDVGVAFENLGGNDVVVGGTVPQRMPSCFATLAKLLCSPFATCLSVLPVNRSQEGGAGERGDLVGAIMHVLGIKDASKVSEEASLGDLGLDSLMAVEIRQYIEREYDMTLNIQEIRALTIARIREIQDAEVARPGGGGAKKPANKEDERRQVSSYGQQQHQQQQQQQQQVAGASRKRATASDAHAHAQQNHPQGPQLDKSMVSTFVPAMELPARDHCRLNHAQPHKSPRLALAADAHDEDSARPLFFLAPIHGSFDTLEPVCAAIRRPCFGLNWTRKLGKVATVAEAVEIYLRLLESADWEREFGLPPSSSGCCETELERKFPHAPLDGGAREQTVDLVGYSFGATIAFELMVAIERRATLHANRLERRLSIGSTAEAGAGRDTPSPSVRNLLKPGRLILLDGSPRQIELGSQYLTRLTSKQPQLRLAEKVDELLMVFVVANVRAWASSSQAGAGAAAAAQKQQQQQQVVVGAAALSGARGEFLALQRALKACAQLEAKVELAARKLLELLPNHHAAAAEKKRPSQEGVAHAMEAFLRRYEMIQSYRAKSKSLAGDCTLIRAEKLYLRLPGGGTDGANSSSKKQLASFDEDLDLGSLVRGRLQLHVMPGDHESFLSESSRAIGTLISRAARSPLSSSCGSSLYGGGGGDGSSSGSLRAASETAGSLYGDDHDDELENELTSSATDSELRSASALSGSARAPSSASESAADNGEQSPAAAATVTAEGEQHAAAAALGARQPPELGA